MHCFDMASQELFSLWNIGAFVAFKNLLWFWRAPFWFRSPNDALFITVVTYAPTRIILRPVGRSNFEYLLVNPVLPHVQDILVNRPLVLKTGYDKMQGDQSPRVLGSVEISFGSSSAGELLLWISIAKARWWNISNPTVRPIRHPLDPGSLTNSTSLNPTC